MTPADPLQILKEAAKDLEYPSESDTSFDLFHWPATGPALAKDQVAAHTGKNRKITQVSIDDFFSALADSDDTLRFTQLRKTLESNLKDLQIFRAGKGETKVDIYLIGKTSAGEWAGLHTTSVET